MWRSSYSTFITSAFRPRGSFSSHNKIHYTAVLTDLIYSEPFAFWKKDKHEDSELFIWNMEIIKNKKITFSSHKMYSTVANWLS